MNIEILTDADVERTPIATFADAIRDFVIADFEGRVTSPPRQAATFPSGKIVFTTGGADRVAGFRAYETFDAPTRADEQQIVAAWDTQTCALEGVCIGRKLGAVRTGILGGLAVTALAPPTARTCALIGTGLQAEAQLRAIAALHPIAEVRVYSRQAAHRDAFVHRFDGTFPAGLIGCATPEDALDGADVAVLATNSGTPVVNADALNAVQHVTTVGPKYVTGHELPLAAADGRLIVSDSPQQLREQGQRHMLFGRLNLNEVRHLGDLLCHGRPPLPARSLYLSAGLAGTEVVALAAMLKHIHSTN